MPRGGARPGAGRKPRGQEKSRPSTDALTVVQPSRNDVTMLTNRELRQICRAHALRWLNRLNKQADVTKNEDWLLRAAKEVFDRAMGPVERCSGRGPAMQLHMLAGGLDR